MKLSLLLAFIFTLLFMLGLGNHDLSAQPLDNPCLKNKDYHIVVLGSSTAAGAGPSSRDSAWVWAFRRHLQKINPANRVTNLANGGYVTYRLMPDEFVSPIGSRPTVDSNKNISAALRLNPDAIIVNLPSNDRQYPIAEQLYNFDSLFAMSNNNGVPIWIFTSQPINGSGAYQAEVKDSIFAKFGSFAIDVWTPFADSNNLAYPKFMADAVHMNNLGHRVLLDQVVKHNVLKDLVDSLTTHELGISALEIIGDLPCIKGDYFLETIVFNSGNNPLKTTINWIDSGNSMGQNISDSTGLLSPCTYDTILTPINLTNYLSQGTINFNVSINPLDSNSSNDSANVQKKTYGNIAYELKNDSILIGASAKVCMKLDSGLTGSVNWFASDTGLNSFYQGECLYTGALFMDTCFYVEAKVSWETDYNYLSIGTEEVNWNGVMFDIIANENILLDSLAVSVDEKTSSQFEVFIKSGTHLGFEMDTTAWHLYDSSWSSFQPLDTLAYLNLRDTIISGGDTLGIYLRKKISSGTINYQRLIGGEQISDGPIDVFYGTGISYGLSAAYFPRKFLGRIIYTAQPTCVTLREKVCVDADHNIGFDELSNGLSVYPNPSRGKLYIPENIDIARIYNIQGQPMLIERRATELDLAKLSNGIYLLKLESNSGAQTWTKIILSK